MDFLELRQDDLSSSKRDLPDHQQNMFAQQQCMYNNNSNQQNQLPSGRQSAPLFGTEQKQKQSEQQNGGGLDDGDDDDEFPSPAESLQQLQLEVERELDALDSGAGQMSSSDQQRYRELLERLVKLRGRKITNGSKQKGPPSSTAPKLPPSMQAAAQHLERF